MHLQSGPAPRRQIASQCGLVIALTRILRTKPEARSLRRYNHAGPAAVVFLAKQRPIGMKKRESTAMDPMAVNGTCMPPWPIARRDWPVQEEDYSADFRSSGRAFFLARHQPSRAFDVAVSPMGLHGLKSPRWNQRPGQ